FADVFASVKRAPLSLAERLAEIPGVAAVEPRIVVGVNVSLPHLSEPASGKIISLPDDRPPSLNRLYLRRGSFLTPRRDDQILVSEAFAGANALDVGGSLSVVINGRLKRLRIVGIALSPEYIYEIKPGDMVPDNRHFGVMWMNEEALATAYDLDGAFNDVAIKTMHGADLPQILLEVDALIKRYGGQGSYDRSDQTSHEFVQNEIEQNRTMGLFAPSIFLGVAAFLLNVVMSRTINSQREQIAALKAFGFSHLEVGLHYLKTALLIVAAALALGLPLGVWFGREVTEMYAKFFHFPEFTYRLHFSVIALSTSVSLLAGAVGCLGAVARAVRLPPAEAMRAEPPTGFGPTALERLGLGHYLPPVARMVVRQLERHPVKTSLSVTAIALAAAVMVVGNFLDDAVQHMMSAQFDRVQRYDVAVTAVEPIDDRALYELQRMPGVMRCEGFRAALTRIRVGPRSRRVGVMGIGADDDLMGLVNQDGTEAALPRDGMIVSRKLAEVLGVSPGEWVEVEFLEGKRPVARVRIDALLEDFAGLAAYVDRRTLDRLLQEGPRLSGAHLMVDSHQLDALYHELKATPKLAGVTVKRHAVESFRQTVGENMGTMKSINLIFACAIAVGVVYNSARISLSERHRELATLRVIGFTRAEISAILLGELAIVTLLAIPLGLLIGREMAQAMCIAFDLELFRFPFTISRRTYAVAALVVLLAAVGSGLLVRRRLDRLDLIAVLKARE
ncbi:MAG: FtsX-like permease family protein, partial [Planctomycetales bacterium]|nr:FtsX-like permease family protein [Planctomycetales bacterium]